MHISKTTLSDSHNDWDVCPYVLEIKVVLSILQNANIFKTLLKKSRADRDVTIVYFYLNHSPR